MDMNVRRQRNDLDRILNRLIAGGDPEATGDLAPLLHPARVARATLVRDIPPAVAAHHLARLRLDRSRNLVVAPAFGRRRMRPAAIGLVALLIFVLTAGSMVAASAAAIPGDTLYGVKRAVERASLGMHRDPYGRAALRLRFAATRLDEIKALIAAGRDPATLLDDLDEELSAAEGEALGGVALGRSSAELLAHVQHMISKHIAVLTDVLGKVPAQAQDAIQRAIDNAEKSQQNVQQGREAKEKGKPSTPPGRSGSAPGRS
jgi:uncharacterized protein DUF5667